MQLAQVKFACLRIHSGSIYIPCFTKHSINLTIHPLLERPVSPSLFLQPDFLLPHVGLLDGVKDQGAGTFFLYAAVGTGAYALWEQLRFRYNTKKTQGKRVPGPSYVTPFLGGLVEMVIDPFTFWDKQRNYADPGYSYNSLFGKLMLFVTDAEKCRELMAVNDPERMLMVLHPSAKTILGANNLAFIHGPEHKAMRKSFLSLFTRKALSTYVQLQDGIIRRHIDLWLNEWDGQDFTEVRTCVRDLNQMTSQEVFIGPYLDDALTKEKFTIAYRDITDGFLAFPICFPGTAVWRARQGRIYVLKVLESCVSRARDYITSSSGAEPRCLMDFWVKRCMEEIAEAAAEGHPPPTHTSDARMADAMLDFLFASQDASTASLVWTMTLMSDYPEILATVREEQERVRPDGAATIDGGVLGQMTYTRQVVKEILRYRAPAPMVPQMTYGNYPLTPEYTIPKGTLVMPSINAANMQGFPDAYKFDPDRFGPERQEDIKYQKSYLTFGAGAHYCVGKEYAINQLVCFLAILSTTCDWTRRRTEDSDKWKYLPTIYPFDSLIKLNKRSSGTA